jgi:hypothetical protein
MVYDYKKTLKKFGIVLVESLIAGALAFVSGTPELMFLVPVFEALRNYLKHK